MSEPTPVYQPTNIKAAFAELRQAMLDAGVNPDTTVWPIETEAAEIAEHERLYAAERERGNTYRRRAIVLAQLCKREREASINYESLVGVIQAEGIRKWKERAEQSEAENERLREHEHEWREAHAMLTGKFETGYAMTHPDGPHTELGYAAMEANVLGDALRAERDQLREAARALLKALDHTQRCTYLWDDGSGDYFVTCPACSRLADWKNEDAPRHADDCTAEKLRQLVKP